MIQAQDQLAFSPFLSSTPQLAPFQGRLSPQGHQMAVSPTFPGSHAEGKCLGRRKCFFLTVSANGTLCGLALVG